MASTVDMRSGLRAMGVLRPEGQPPDEPVALETPVVATGARPGPAGSKRELFSEETQTVLVFEKGAVIRLSAGVADGQLLFLTNKKTGKEVVTQVVRKRSFRPTSCYVDLEFTEASPGFWGLELPKSAPTVPRHAASGPGEEEPSDCAKPSVPPDLQEVARLKTEVAELQAQLKTLSGSSAGGEAAPLPAAGETEAVEQREEKLLAQLFAQEARQEQLHGPQRLVAYPKKQKNSVAKAASKAATAGAFAAVVVAAAVAAYRFGLFDSLLAKPAAGKPAPASPIAPVLPSAAKPASTLPMPASSNAAPHGIDAATAKENLTGKSPTEAGADPVAIDAAQPYLVPRSKTPAATPPGAKRPGIPNTASSADVPARSGSASDPAVPVAENGGATDAEDYVAPKLVYSVKAVSPPEALRNYVTGNVSVDALVDVAGHVKSVSVISGPQKLRNTAIAEMKQYRYEPARKNGKPVAAHVRVSLKYWYEP